MDLSTGCHLDLAAVEGGGGDSGRDGLQDDGHLAPDWERGGLQGHYDNGGGDGLLGVAGDDASLHEVLDNEDGLNIVAVDHGGLGEVVEGAVLFREVISGIAATGRG